MIIPITLLAVASLTALTSAFPKLGTSLSRRDLSCPTNVLSCTAESKDVNGCCLPTMGLLVLAQDWNLGFGPANEFTVRGLWPNTCSGEYGPPSGCDASRIYSDVETHLRNYPSGPSMLKEMHTYWPTYSYDSNAFWSIAWSKYGTCLSNLAPACQQRECTGSPSSRPVKDQDVYTYFETALKLRGHSDLYQTLAAGGIVPGSIYSVDKIQEVLRERFGVRAGLNCRSGALKEIWLYFRVKSGMHDFEYAEPVHASSCQGFIVYPQKTKG